jgi:hypothetical protein
VQEPAKPAAARPITPQAPAVAAKPAAPAVAAKPAASRVQPAPRTAAPVAKADMPVPRAKESSPGAAHERSGAKTLMGTGLDEMRKALAQLDSKAPAPPTAPSAQPPMLGAEKISDDTTGEGATLVRSSPFDASVAAHEALAKQSLVEEASTEDEQTVLIPQPTQEELIAASERGVGRTTRRQLRDAMPVEDESGEGDTLVKESPFAAAESERPMPSMEPEPPTVQKPQPAQKVGAMGTMMMPTAPSAPAMAVPPAPPPPTAPVATPHGTAIMEPALAATVAAQASPPAPPPPEMTAPPMPGPMAPPAHMSPPENAYPVGPSGPEAPSFLRDGPAYEAPAPARRKKSRAPMFGVGIAAAALVAAGAWLSLRNGWIDELIGSTTGKATPTASAKPSAAPSAHASAAPSAAEPASATPEPATAAPKSSAAPAASATAAASAAPSASPSAKPAAGSADASALPRTKGILMVTATQPGVVYVNGKFVGNAGEPLTVDCGIKYIRLAEPGAAPGKPPTFVGHGRPLKIGCQKTTEAVLPAPPGLDGPAARPNEDTPAPGGNPAPDL